MLLLTLLIILICSAFGLGILSWLDSEGRIGGLKNIVIASALGTILWGFLILADAVIFRSLALAIYLNTAIVAVLAALMFRRVRARAASSWKEFSIRSFPVGKALVCILIAATLIVAFRAMVWVDGFPYGVLKGWGDGAYHLDMVQTLATSDPFQLTHPVAASTPLSYTFFVNFLSAVFVKIGVPVSDAWNIPLFIFGIALVIGLYSLGQEFFRRRALAVAFAFIVICGGGLGFAWLGAQIAKDYPSQGPAAIISNIVSPKYEYTHLDIRSGGKPQEKNSDVNIVWITPLISFFSHQRSFLPGAALGVIFLYGAWLYRGQKSMWRWLMLLGLLPIIHVHTLLGMSLVALALIVDSLRGADRRDRRRILKMYAVGTAIAIVVALPQLLFLFGSSLLGGSQAVASTSSSFTPWFGWMMCTHSASWLSCDPGVAGTDTNALWFWTKNFGIIFLAWAALLLVPRWRKSMRGLSILMPVSVILFAVPNLVKLQPWEFDNNKLLFYWWLLAIALALKLFDGDARGHIKKKAAPYMAGGLALFIFISMASGSVDILDRVKRLWNIDINETHFGYYGPVEQALAQEIRANTEPDAAFLTSSSPSQFIPMAAGRPIYLGYQGWLWTQGRQDTIAQRVKKIQLFALSGDDAALCADGIHYFLYDSAFHDEYASYINRDLMLTDATLVRRLTQDSGDYGIYRLNCRQ
jgi:hypothetical protein